MKVNRFILSNRFLEVHIADLGATIMKMVVKDVDSQPVDIVLGFDDADQYASADYLSNYPYFGAMMGRCAGRIGNASFTIDGTRYALSANVAPHHLHGGFSGFDRKIWTMQKHDDHTLQLHYVSPDGEEGYPGNLDVTILFQLEEKELKISYTATTDKKCPVSLTHHPYFNLSPEQPDIKRQCLRLYSDKYLATEQGISTGEVLQAEGLYLYDEPKALRAVIEEGNSLDDCYVFGDDGQMKLMAEISHPDSKISVALLSDYPAAVVYAGEYIGVRNGKQGREYQAYAGLAIEPQYSPNTANLPSFPSNLLSPGETYHHTLIYRIS